GEPNHCSSLERPMRPAHTLAVAGAAVLSISALAGCGGDDKSGAKGDSAKITATDKSCEIGKKEFPAGTHTFKVKNEGSKVTEVYFYAPGAKIVTERENIAPGTSVDVVAQLSAGKYQVA